MHKKRNDLHKLRAAFTLGVSFYHGKFIEGGFAEIYHGKFLEGGFAETSPDRNLYLVGSTSVNQFTCWTFTYSARQTFLKAKYYLEIAAGSQVPGPESINAHEAYKFLGFTLLDLFEKDYRLNDMSCFEAQHRQMPCFNFQYNVDLEPGFSAVPLAMYWLKEDAKRSDKFDSRCTMAQLTEKFENSCANCGKGREEIDKDLSKCSRLPGYALEKRDDKRDWSEMAMCAQCGHIDCWLSKQYLLEQDSDDEEVDEGDNDHEEGNNEDDKWEEEVRISLEYEDYCLPEWSNNN
ncbi:hypothetical protein THAOC_31690 [Thalassiosira oceanica]|uniref:Uncharacterized protein n=1 Tax=Thalassiosira oceanica TaxID=159749 RepID=K0R8Q2_THAOC|nr:hypothetical protein THAOC_31690 [Thalassiosira oceanica]|eukprot:EJK49435.1 hypothetical protein THAOC_31690 [Thalassiosira oceanica]